MKVESFKDIFDQEICKYPSLMNLDSAYIYAIINACSIKFNELEDKISKLDKLEKY